MANIDILLKQQRRNLLAQAALARKQQNREYDLESAGGSSLGTLQAVQKENRATNLKRALKRGKIAPEALSDEDSRLIGLPQLMAKRELEPVGVGDAIGDAASGEGDEEDDGPEGFFDTVGNLGQDIISFGAGLPQGLYETGKNVVEDAGTGIQKGLDLIPGVDIEDTDVGTEGSDVFKEILKPIGESYEHTYGPLFSGDPGTTWERVKEHPLGPVLDIGTVFTGGALGAAKAGSAASRVARGGSLGEGRVARAIEGGGEKLASIRDRDSRPDIELSEGVTIPRRYSRGPVMKYGVQKPLDLLTRNPDTPLGKISRKYRLNKDVDRSFAKFRVAEGILPEENAAHVVESLKVLDDTQYKAWLLGAQGINLQRLPGFEGNTMLDAAADFWERSLRNENDPGQNVADYGGEVPTESVQQLIDAARNPEVRALIMRPTQEMRDAHETYRAYLEEKNMESPVKPEEIEMRRWAPTQALRRQAVKDPAGAFERYTEGLDDQPLNPIYIEHKVARGEMGRKDNFKPKQRKYDPREVGNPLDKGRPSYFKDYDMSAFTAGVWRTDRNALIDHLARRERDLIHNEFNDEFTYRWAHKDSEGEPVQFKGNADTALRKQGLDPDEWEIVVPGAAVRWFRAELNYSDEILKILDEAPKNAEGRIIDTNELRAKLDEVADGDAEAFQQEHLSAMNEPGFAMPKEAVNRLRQSIAASEHHSGVWRSMMNKWRTLTLAYMPRWWFNTVVGNSILALMAGAWGRGNLRTAKRLIGEKKVPIEWRMGVYGTELLEGGRGGLQQGLAGRTSKVTKTLFGVNQRVEDYIRVMAGTKFLKDETRMYMRGAGDVLENHGKWGITDEMIDEILETHPELVAAAADEMNKFFYNYMQLGPFERRHVRNFIPFWGWYKFATKLAWRLPVEYPGRMNIFNHLSEIGQDAQEEMGLLPPDIIGSILLNRDAKSLMTLPAFGMNPLGEFASPFGPEGPIAGILKFSQFAPPIQAFLTAHGTNPWGGQSSSSPEMNIASSFLGRTVDPETGFPKPPSSEGSVERFFGSLGRSIPQVSLLERLTSGGRPVYPESIPIFNQRPIPVDEDSMRDTDPLSILGQFSGLEPRRTNLIKERGLAEEEGKYARSRLRSQRKDLRKAGL